MAPAPPPAHVITAGEQKVIFASSLGTIFEWYDFYLYGSLATILARQFFSGVDESTGFIFALLAFAAGFIVRPFGALIFGRQSDMIGRKYVFLLTILIMGSSTFIVGLLPSYASVGIAAPIALITMRILQGLALGGEYGGAATYVAEHAPNHQRGLFTSWIQTTATMGLLMSLLIILGMRSAVGEDAFQEWGWRIPFLVSVFLLAVSVWIRMSLHESPAFARMKAQGRTSRAPLFESFGRWKNMKLVILALFGLTAGQAVIWYTGQFYALFFLVQTLKVDGQTANLLIAASLLLGTPFFIVFGALSDKIGRKPIIMAGCLLAALTYFPIFKAITHYANPALEAAQASAPVTVRADPSECHFLFNPADVKKFNSSCDIARTALTKAAVNYGMIDNAAGAVAAIHIGAQILEGFDTTGLSAADAALQTAAFTKRMTTALKAAGYPAKADPEHVNRGMLLLLLFVLVLWVTMVYGPLAALLVEMFPTRIRTTSMSLPYHIGNGWFGGFL
ncbi:MAG: MFS transporter, partial [Oxalobacteraceae bacterium]